MATRVGQIIRSMLTVDWTQFDGLGALRCTVGVAVPLVVGQAIGQPPIGVFGAMGAVGAGFGSFQGAYRGRAAVMLLAAVGMAFSVFIGSLAGRSNSALIVIAAFWAFGGGLLVAIGRGASFVGLQSIVALVIAAGYPSDLADASERALLVFSGGAVQTLLVVMIWPLRRYTAERRSLAAVYRSLAAYASTIPTRQAIPPEPHTLAGTVSPLADPQPFAPSDRIFIFQTLLDEAERIRASLAALAVRYLRRRGPDQAGETALAELASQALAEIAAALAQEREPREPPGFPEAPAGGILFDPLLGQIRAAWRTAGMLMLVDRPLAPRREPIARPRRWPAIRNAIVTLRANLTTRSTAWRHTLRLTAALTLGAAGAAGFGLQRGYWVPMTIALVLKPDYHDTFTFSMGRVGGTVLGALLASTLSFLLGPGTIAPVVLVLGFVWGMYGFRTANYGAFSVCVTGYVVFLLSLSGTPETTAAGARIIATAIGGAIALGAYLMWPTWTAMKARPAIAAMLEAQSAYLRSLLASYAVPSRPPLEPLGALRAAARLARSNAEAIVERMLTEPRARYTLRSQLAVGIVGATHRNALAALSLHAGLEHDSRDAVPGIQKFASDVGSSLRSLAHAVADSSVPPSLPSLRQGQLQLAAVSNDVISAETDFIVDSIDTIAELVAMDTEKNL